MTGFISIVMVLCLVSLCLLLNEHQRFRSRNLLEAYVSISGHKFVGCPMPCVVQMTRLEHINTLSSNVEHLASRDATIMGSRNGHTSIFLWYTLNRKGYRGFQKEVKKCLANAHYLKDRLRNAGMGAMLNGLSSTVVFERPRDEEFVRKWQLACQGNIAHVIVTPNITVEKLDHFLKERTDWETSNVVREWKDSASLYRI